MPNRILRDYTDSEVVNQLSWQAEVLFIRLMMKADDFGSFHAEPALVKSLLFPWRTAAIRDTDISRWIAECEKAGLVVVYTVAAKKFMRIVNFGQRLRSMKNKFPDPPDSNSPQSAATRRNPPPEDEGETETETEVEDEGEPAPPPSFPNLISSIESLKDEALKDQYYFVEHVCRQNRITPQEVTIRLEAFNEHLRSIGELTKTKKDYRLHFQNWLKKQQQSKPQSQTRKMREI